ncbi:hypothetical protein ZWY2020_012364 [Hordeum vulgare]|nr:hypothetical protein ZWY2020_012364 [Hordeum vulgare]
MQQSSNSTGNLQETAMESGHEPGKQTYRSENSDSTSMENMVAQDDQKQNDGNDEEQGDQSDRVGQWFARFLDHDLLLLENQIPIWAGQVCRDIFAVYPKVIQEAKRPTDFHHLLHLSHMYFKPSEKFEDFQYQIGPRYIDRFLSFGRKYLKLGHLTEYDEQSSLTNGVDVFQANHQLNRWRRAAQYIEAGVKFKRRGYGNDDPHSLLDIRFIYGTMEIPCQVVDEYTGALFRNLIAFEQTCPQFGDDFRAYVIFLSQFINMPEDVSLLARREIIVHHLESDDKVLDLFAMLTKDVVFDFNGEHYLRTLCQIMEVHYQSRLNRWMAWLWLNHFRNPWLVLAAFATAVVLVCTVLQTVYGILAYVDPPK